MDKLSLKKMTYYGIPLSVIYKQFIRFMKENEIYTLYLEISLPQTKMSYETFLENVLMRKESDLMLDRFFLFEINIGSDLYQYAKYEDGSDNFNSAINFLEKINYKWVSFLAELRAFQNSIKTDMNYDFSA